MKTILRLFVFVIILLFPSSILMGQQAIEVKPGSSTEVRFRLYYPVNETRLYEDYMDNAIQLHRIQRAFERPFQLDSIVIYSYASPEGPYFLNKRLAAKRGKNAKKYLLDHVFADRHLPDSMIVISPTAENWDGLRERVLLQYEYDDKDEVLAILDRTDITDEQRKMQLKQLKKGKSWQYIIKEIMPRLRYATWISIWHHPKVEKTSFKWNGEFPKMQPLQPVMMQILPSKLLEQDDTKTILALKTNLLYDAVSWLNFSLEVPIGEKFSALYYHQFPWWTWGKANNEYCMRFLSIGAEARWWFKPMPREATVNRIKRDRLMGHFLGVYLESGKWDFERKRDICYQGEHWSAGLSYGYAMPIGKRLNLELSASVGYASIPHRGYEPKPDYSELYHLPEKDGRWHYIGPTKLQVSLVVPITVRVKKGGGR